MNLKTFKLSVIFCTIVKLSFGQDETISNDELYNSNENANRNDRQLEAFALLPIGFVIGSLGAAIIPNIFTTTTTTVSTTTKSSSTVQGSNNGGVVLVGTSPEIVGQDQIVPAGITPIDNTQVDAPAPTSPEVIGSGVTYPTSNAPSAKQVLENQEGCGIRASQGTRIVGGSPVDKNEYPWLCSLKYKGGHICGITLISVYPQQTILVGAAHCYNHGDASDYLVTCGEHQLNVEEPEQVDMDVTEVVVHPNYKTATDGYDIAVYKVDPSPLRTRRRDINKSVLWSSCLPTPGDSYEGGNYVVAGWGLTKTKLIRGQNIEVRGIQNTPQHVEVPAKRCEDKSGASYPNGLICSGEQGRDSCQGDSGGPLVRQTTGPDGQEKFEWIGIVSYGVGCGEDGYPGAYTRTSCYIDWIAQQFGMIGTSSSSSSSGSWSTPCFQSVGSPNSDNTNIGATTTIAPAPINTDDAVVVSAPDPNSRLFESEDLTVLNRELPDDTLLPSDSEQHKKQKSLGPQQQQWPIYYYLQPTVYVHHPNVFHHSTLQNPYPFLYHLK